MKRDQLVTILILVAVYLLTVWPLIYYGTPYYASSPDMAYVRAKILEVSHGNLFTDPISGLINFHPPIYHLFLTPLKLIGLGYQTIFLLVGLFNIAGLIGFGYLIMRQVYDRASALGVILLLPFTAEYMGSGGILLASSFYFSVPFYLAGLWLYFSRPELRRARAATAVLWGLAFLISPVYLFLIGLTLVRDIYIRRREGLFMTAVFLISIFPFYIQAVLVYTNGMGGASAFAFWRGIPDGDWLVGFFREFLSPARRDIFSVPAMIHAVILILFIATALRVRRFFWFIGLLLIAYILTYYHFDGQYAIRIQLFLSLFLVGFLIFHGRAEINYSRWWLAPVLILMSYGLYLSHDRNISYFNKEEETYRLYLRSGQHLWTYMDRFLEEDQYILSTQSTYGYFVMGYSSARALSAYRTLEYFQIPAEISERYHKDYITIMHSEDYAEILDITSRYNINTALFSANEFDLQIYKVLSLRWEKVYEGPYFIILKNPDA